jgi:hypothetical protein
MEEGGMAEARWIQPAWWLRPPAPWAATWPVPLGRLLRGPLGGVAAAAIGLLLVAAVFGLQILPPHRTGWMLKGTIGPDPVQYWLGWTYFSRAPWNWPPGANPDWGLEIGSSIFFSDSIPLLAFAFMALRGLVEVPQYWGLWLYACGALQALLAWRLIGLATPDPLARLAGAALFVLQPILLNRMGGHFALAGQFLLLAGLLLCLTTSPQASQPAAWMVRRLAAWAALLLAASLVHSYLLPMVAGLWATDWLTRAVARDRRPPLLAAEALAVPGAGLLGLWLAGFFLLDGGLRGTWGGYGEMQLDLLAPFDPAPWGRFLPDLPQPGHLESQDSYLGLGALWLLAAGGLAAAWRPSPWLARRWPLLLGLLGMLAIAISHRVTLGGQLVAVLAEPPDWLLDAASALRASVRFFWPVAYAAQLGAIFALARALGGQRTGWLLAVLVAIQAADLQPGFARIANYFPPAPAVAPLRLQDPFWQQAAARDARIRLAPTGMQARHWEEVAVLAATAGLPTDAVYLARLDPDRVAALNAATAARLARGRPEPGSLYVLGDAAMLAAARQGLDPGRDLLAEIEGIWVLAPGWRDTWRVTVPWSAPSVAPAPPAPPPGLRSAQPPGPPPALARTARAGSPASAPPAD